MYNAQNSTIGATRTTVAMGFRQTDRLLYETVKKVTRKLLRQKTVVTYLLIHKSSHSTWDYHEINSINESSTALGNCD
jgi:hypothetical protein